MWTVCRYNGMWDVCRCNGIQLFAVTTAYSYTAYRTACVPRHVNGIQENAACRCNGMWAVCRYNGIQQYGIQNGVVYAVVTACGLHAVTTAYSRMPFTCRGTHAVLYAVSERHVHAVGLYLVVCTWIVA